jgi:saccharopine dehydrogenase-like NADP-dependent oxidoreductase
MMEFPEPVGKIEVFHIGHPEPITLHKYFPEVKYIDDKASFNPPIVNDWIVSLRQLGLCSEEPIKLNGVPVTPMDLAAVCLQKACKSLPDYRKEGAIRVEVKGRSRGKTTRLIYSATGRIAEGTGIAASIGAQLLAESMIEDKGVFAPEGCIDPGIFLQELLDNRSIGELNTRRIEE